MRREEFVTKFGEGQKFVLAMSSSGEEEPEEIYQSTNNLKRNQEGKVIHTGQGPKGVRMPMCSHVHVCVLWAWDGNRSVKERQSRLLI